MQQPVMDMIYLLQVNIQILLEDRVFSFHVEYDVEPDDQGLKGGGHHPHVVLVVVLGKQIVGFQSE